MTCTKCGELLDASPGKSVNFCPNCGSKVAATPDAAVTDSAEAALRHIADNYGADVLLGSKIVTYFADVTRNQLAAERKLIKILSDEGALDCLKAAIGKPGTEQALAVKRGVARLPFAKAEGEDMLYNFAAALGWSIAKPQPAPANAVLPPRVSVTPAIGSTHKFANIDWRVLDVDKQNNKALLISEEILEKRPYSGYWKSIKWENCTLRKYLNSEFLDKLGAAKSAIAETRNSNPDNPWYGTAGGNATTDKVFLLSLDELVKYFGDSGDLRNKKRYDWDGYDWENGKFVPSSNGWFLHDQYDNARIAKYGNEGASWWWLRSLGYYSNLAAFVYDDGFVDVHGYDVIYDSGGVRPALWVNL